eukprot:14424551-Alexandrium_andersonii.AAC.1
MGWSRAGGGSRMASNAQQLMHTAASEAKPGSARNCPKAPETAPESVRKRPKVPESVRKPLKVHESARKRPRHFRAASEAALCISCCAFKALK